jgi:uncharacterized protein YgbK (DUF1537 family)
MAACDTQSGEATMHSAMCGRKVLLIADDLTGACDAAGAFASHGVCSTVVFDPADVACTEGAQVMALSTETRDIATMEMKTALRDALASASESTLLFKKIDSVFRGNTFHEIAETAKLAQGKVILIAPAFPAHGRTCRNGVVRFELNGVTQEILAADALRTLGLQVVSLAASDVSESLQRIVRSYLDESSSIFLADAETDAEMQQIVETFSSLGVAVVWIGSAGLAHALAHAVQESEEQLPVVRHGLVIFCIGSDHPVTRGQLETLLLKDAKAHVLPLPRGVAGIEDVQAFFTTFEPQQLGCVVMTGGDTASLVCRALGVTAIDIAGELSPGVPCGVLRGGPLDGVNAVLKSGGFGTPQLFLEIANKFERNELN